MLDIPMPQILLQRMGIDALIGEVKSTRMVQHMRMDWKGECGGDACVFHGKAAIDSR